MACSSPGRIRVSAKRPSRPGWHSFCGVKAGLFVSANRLPPGRIGLIVVARRTLGTLNHTLLTLEVAQSRGLPIAGVVVNETEPCQGIAAETNIEELRRRMDVPLLAVVPYGGDAAAALNGVDWLRL